MSQDTPDYGTPASALPTPADLGVDTSLTTPGSGIDGIDAAEFTTTFPSLSFDDFHAAASGPGISPYGFSQAMANADTTRLNGSQKDSAPSGGNASGVRAQVVKYAKQFLGMQYKWGGSNPNTSFDCSGFVQYVTGKFGVHLPRISYQQVNSGKHIALKDLQAGDIVGWDENDRNVGADHVALYIGGGQIMEFYRTGKPSRIRKLGSNEGAIGVRIDYKE